MLIFKKSLVLAGLGLVLSNSVFAAPNSPYFRVDAGYVRNNSYPISVKINEYNIKKGKFAFGAGVGYQLNNNLRYDFTFTVLSKNKVSLTPEGITAYTNYQPGSGDLVKDKVGNFNVNLLMANIYYDFYTNKNDLIVPYITAGVGLGMVSKISDFVNGNSFSEEAYKAKSRFAYSLGLGISSNLNSNLTLDVGYKFTQISTKNIPDMNGNPLGYKYNNNAFMIGLRVSM